MGNIAKVDQKGRLTVPKPLVPALRELGADFYITSENGDSVRIYPAKVWRHMEERLQRSRSRRASNERLLVRAKYFGRQVKMDRQGRLLIPLGLRNSAQMKGTVDVLDFLTYLEVWNHARLLKYLKSSPITPQDARILNKLSAISHALVAAQDHRRTQSDGQVRHERRFQVHRRLTPDPRNRVGPPVREAQESSAKRRRVA